MSPSGGQVGPTPQELTLASNAQASFNDYRQRWLPMQQHLADVVNDMGQPDSWQRREAEGKGNVDVSAAFAARDSQQTASMMSRGINPGSSAFKMAVASGATAQAAAKGIAVEKGNQDIDRAYIENLSAITAAGQKLAGAATQGQSVAGEVASREAISNAQVQNQETANTYGAIGFGIGALSSPQGKAALSSAGSGIADWVGNQFSSGGNGIAGPTVPEVTQAPAGGAAQGTTTYWGPPS
jgi:hypothetical protein